MINFNSCALRKKAGAWYVWDLLKNWEDRWSAWTSQMTTKKYGTQTCKVFMYYGRKKNVKVDEVFTTTS